MAVIKKIIDYCTGCSACSIVCPRQAISMGRNEKGFLVPIISYEKCINCGMCEKVCHQKNTVSSFVTTQMVLAAKNKSDEERLKSSSGGVFLLIAKLILEEKGVVYASAFDNCNVVKYIRATSIEDVLTCCQSKYVQSDIGDSIHLVIQDIKDGKKVLFVGTPCQISAIRNSLDILNVRDDNLLLIDFVCHGTPSPRVFHDYLSMIEEKYNGRVKHFYFRDKEQGWRGNGYKAEFFNRKTVVNGYYLRGYNKLFPLSTNEACFHCLYSRPERISDITLGDFWGIESTAIASFEDKLGVSMLLVNTEKGNRWITRVKEKMIYRSVNLESCKKNTPLFHQLSQSDLYEEFWRSYIKDGYKTTFDKFCKFIGIRGFFELLKWFIMYKLNFKDYIIMFVNMIKK